MFPSKWGLPICISPFGDSSKGLIHKIKLLVNINRQSLGYFHAWGITFMRASTENILRDIYLALHKNWAYTLNAANIIAIIILNFRLSIHPPAHQ